MLFENIRNKSSKKLNFIKVYQQHSTLSQSLIFHQRANTTKQMNHYILSFLPSSISIKDIDSVGKCQCGECIIEEIEWF